MFEALLWKGKPAYNTIIWYNILKLSGNGQWHYGPTWLINSTLEKDKYDKEGLYKQEKCTKTPAKNIPMLYSVYWTQMNLKNLVRIIDCDTLSKL